MPNTVTFICCTLLWVFTLLCLTHPALADNSSNDTCATAEQITLDYTGNGSLRPRWLGGDRNDYYSFTAAQDGTVNISLTGTGASSITTQLYNSDCSTELANGNSIIHGVTSGTQYKIRLSATSVGRKRYTLTVTFIPAPVADLRFDQCSWDGTLGEVLDSSGNGYDATAQGAANTDQTDSAICQAAVFNGDPDYLASARELAPLRNTATLSMWIQTSQTGASRAWQSPAITGIEERGGTDDIFWGWLDGQGRIGVTVGNNNATKSSTIISDGTWHHVVLSRDGVTGAYAIYIDGNLDASGTSTSGVIGNTFSSIGRAENTDPTTNPRYFIGKLDELKIFDQVLSQAQVQTIYANEAAGNNYDGTNRVCPACPAHEFRFDECSWDGTADQIINQIDSTNNGTAINGAASSQTPPAAIAGDPGTCGYGIFDGIDDYIALPNMPNYNTSFTITAWINPSSVGNDQRIFADDENNSGGFAFSLGDGGNGRLRFFSRGSSTDILDSPAVISANQWYFVSAVYDADARTKAIYVNGSQVASKTDNTTWGSDPGIASIGGETNGAGGEAVPNWRFDGQLDEIRIYEKALTASQINLVYNETHACPSCATTPDHFAISHSGTAINCLPEDVTISAHDASHNVLTTYTGTIDISTSTGNGDWLPGTAGGTLTPGAADSGQASYAFAAADNGSVTLQLKDTHVETVNINVVEGAVTETSGSALASEDPDLAFAETGFLFYGNTTANNIGSQICGKSSDSGFGSQNLEIAAIRTNDQTGACEAALTGTTTIEIAFTCRNPTTCTSNQLQINGVSSANLSGSADGAALSYTSVNLDFGTATDFTAPFTMTYQDAGLIRLSARYEIPLANGTPSGTYMLGNSNDFVSRPFGLLVDDNLTYTDSATTCSSTTCQVAGQNFTISSTAYCMANLADDSDSNGIPDIFEDDDPTIASTISNNASLDTSAPASNFGNETTAATASLSHHLIAPTAGGAGTFSATATTFSNGSGTSSDANWNEVGVITVQADSSYLGTSVRGISAQVGRFIPARLSVSANTPVFDFFCSSAGVDFNYLGQEFGFATDPVFTVTALNSSGSTTSNYGGSFWQLSSSLSNRFYTNNQPATAATLSRTTDGGNATLAGENDYDGLGTLTVSGDRLTYARPASPEAPFFALVHLDLTAADLTDDDGVCYDPDNNSTCDGFQVQNITSTAYNTYGRLLVRDNYGPQDEDITASPFLAQYYDGTAWLTNIYDDCSTGLSFCSTPAGHPVSDIFPDPLSGGQGSLTVGANGTAETVQVCPTAPAWLTDHSNCATPDAVCGTFTFGIYRGNDRIINWREVVR